MDWLLILVGGFLGAGLAAIAIAQTQRARKHNQERAEAELRLGNEIIAKMEGALYLVRASDGVVVYANPSFEKMFGYDSGEVIGKHVAELNAPTGKTPERIAQEIFAALTRDGQWRGEVLARRKNGSTFWSSIVVSTFDHLGLGKVWVS